MAPIRRAGRASQPGGAIVTWSRAEGAHGTRWREVITTADGLVRAVTLEVSATGRSTRLEVATKTGMLTLHPEPDESALYGNVVTATGVRHLAFDWSPDHEILLLASPASATSAFVRLAEVVSVGASRGLDVLRVDDTLEPRPERWTVARLGAREWTLRSPDGSEDRHVRLDEEGLPMLPDAASWPLERRR